MSKIDLSGVDIQLMDGSTIHGSSLKGKTVLFVNVASKCGFTPQYEALEQLHETYGPRGLVIIGAPTDQFKQELGTDAEVAEFCKLNYGVTFGLTQKLMVNGSQRHPLFAQLTKAKDGMGLGGPVLWNFEKFLLLPDGSVKRFRSPITPDSKSIVDLIEASL